MSGKKPAAALVAYEAKPHETAALKRWRQLRDENRPLPAYCVRDNGEVGFDHPDPPTAVVLIMEALGITATGQYMSVIHQVVNATSKEGRPDADGINGVVSFAAGMKPTNPTEAMLAIQTATIHQLTMSEARKLRQSDFLPQYEAYSTTLNKLARTFTTQVETMKKLRSGGPQRVVVEHKHYHLHQTPEAAAPRRGEGEGWKSKRSTNPMNGVFPNAKQCSATSKRTGCRCRAPAVKGWNVCRFHGANGGAPAGAIDGRYRHGCRTIEARAARRLLRELLAEARDLCGILAA